MHFWNGDSTIFTNKLLLGSPMFSSKRETNAHSGSLVLPVGYNLWTVPPKSCVKLSTGGASLDGVVGR